MMPKNIHWSVFWICVLLIGSPFIFIAQGSKFVLWALFIWGYFLSYKVMQLFDKLMGVKNGKLQNKNSRHQIREKPKSG